MCVRVTLTHSFSAADANCAASVDAQLDFFQSWLGNRNRNNWNSSRRKFACVASISNSRRELTSPHHPTHHTTPHPLHLHLSTRAAAAAASIGDVVSSAGLSLAQPRFTLNLAVAVSVSVAVSAGAGVSFVPLCTLLVALPGP